MQQLRVGFAGSMRGQALKYVLEVDGAPGAWISSEIVS
jgi:hypothetical protein